MEATEQVAAVVSQMINVLRVLLVVFFIGWVIPLWFAGNQLLVWANGIELQRVDSFPHLHVAKICFSVSMVWVLVVMACLALLIPKNDKASNT